MRNKSGIIAGVLAAFLGVAAGCGCSVSNVITPDSSLKTLEHPKAAKSVVANERPKALDDGLIAPGIR